MSYIDIINRFWQVFEDTALKPNDTLLYLYLVKVCNSKSWQNPFSISNKKLVTVLEISEKSIIDSRARLVERNLIKFKKGDRNCSSPKYFIEGVDTENFNCNLESRMADERQMNGRRKVAINKTIDIDLENNTTSSKVSAPPKDVGVVEKSLFEDEEKKSKKRKPAKPMEPSLQPPTLEEVHDYFREVNAPERIDDWERSAQIFFDTYAENAWLNKYNRSIVKTWRNAASKWIAYREEEVLKQKTKHEIKQTDKFSERRGTEPGTTSRKGFKGTF